MPRPPAPPARPRATFGIAALALALALPASAQTVAVRAFDWLRLPVSGNLSLSGSSLTGNPTYLSRINFVRPEPGGSGRLWLCDLNGNLFILPAAASTDLAARSDHLHALAAAGSPYLDFNGSTSGHTNDRTFLPVADGTAPATPDGIFRRFIKQSGYANGLVTFQFDPEYPANGRFYTVHIESHSSDSDSLRLPLGGAGTKHPGLDVAGYASTPLVAPPAGGTSRHAVVVEWTDTAPADTVFQGSAREILRLGYTGTTHPLGDLIFNPLALDAAHPDWGSLYLANGDGGAGESASNDDGVSGLTAGDRHYFPQRLDTLLGKTLRIIPDLSRRVASSTLSANGRYRVPNDNPYRSVSGARAELWTVGHRNPHRFYWDAPTDTLLVCEIGQHAWEEVNVLQPGRNYGYPHREGPQRLIISTGADNKTLVAPPDPDTLPVRIGLTTTGDVVTPAYPAVVYPHTAPHGDAIANGFVYRGRAVPALRERFVFGDITTGRVFHASFADMLAAHAANGPASQAAFSPLEISWDDPATPAGPQTYARFFEIIQAAYRLRGGTDADLPGGSTISGAGRADIRLWLDAEGELHVLSKSDGMIRALTALPSKPDWLSAHFTAGELTQPAVSDDLADPDADGRPNFLEYALGSAPRSPDAPAALAARLDPAGRLALDYPAPRPELRYQIERSSDLVAWTAAGIDDAPAADPGENPDLRTASAPRDGDAPLFLRLRVTPRQ